MVDRKRESIVENTKNILRINYYIDMNAENLIATFCSAFLVLSSSNKWSNKAVSHSNWRQKGRGKDTRMLFILTYFFAPISIYYFPHNYVIPQAMPHAISQTHEFLLLPSPFWYMQAFN